ncbi:zinc ribbon domain-containing protein [Trueperella pyogenes]|uniref:zinc ribbon domain-containing protein n=1 Tax=Trueperella pyogenes TaxID=1661 RepID=UPI00345D5ABD
MFDEVQRRFAINKRRGAKTKAELAALGKDAPDYWLTGHGCCLTCGGPMEGVSGTSKTGRKYRYYYCLNQRKKKCTAKTVRKDEIEMRVDEIVESFLADPEMLASLAVDLADHHSRPTDEETRSSKPWKRAAQTSRSSSLTSSKPSPKASSMRVQLRQ